MSNTELFFIGTDFTPIVKNSNGRKTYGFGFFGKIDGVTFVPNGEKKGPKGCLASLYNNQEKQFDILRGFLYAAQDNVDDMILDPSLRDEDKLLFDYYNQTMYFGGLVGVVSIKDFEYEGKPYDITLQINTRMDSIGGEGGFACSNAEEKGKEKFKPFFLMTLLFDGFIPLGGSAVNNDSEALTDMLLLYSFVEKYKKAYVKGYYKTYHGIQRNDSHFKGSIDIARQMRLNCGLNNGKIAYSYREKGELNYINHLIIAAYEQLKGKYREQTNFAFKGSLEARDSLESLRFLASYPLYTKKTLIAKTSNPISHPFYTEYEDLRKTCLKILREEKMSLFNGDKSEKVEGVLMYVPDLWEKYLEKFFENLKFKAQDQIKIMDVNSSQKYEQNTRPDFVFYNEDNPYMILDAKFKPGWLAVAQNGRVGDLLLPDYDKCIRDMVSINADAAGVIFPTKEKIVSKDTCFEKGKDGKSFEYVHSISKFNSKQKFYTFPIYVPSAEGSFGIWRRSFIDSCKGVFEKINRVIKKHS